ncbi:MAG: hypothetical protein KC933_00055 [Myxococcales bacterium]|nr:hypothetical protein [Myxococcales bacterium]
MLRLRALSVLICALTACSDGLVQLERTGPFCSEISCGMYEYCVDDGLAATCDCIADYVRCEGVCVHESAPCGGESDGGVAGNDAGLDPTQVGRVSGVVLLLGATDHAGTRVTVAGLVGVTDASGRFELAGVPVGSHAIRAVQGLEPATATVEGRVRFSDGRADLSEVHAFLQVFPTTWDPYERNEVAVFAGQETVVDTITLRRTATYLQSAPVSSDGRYMLQNVPVGTFSAPSDLDAPGELGTYGFVASDLYDLRPMQIEGPRPVGLGFAQDTDDLSYVDPEVAHAGPLVVDASAGGAVPDLALYRYEPIDLYEPASRPHDGYDFDADAWVRNDEAGADLRVVDPNPTGGPANVTLSVQAGAGSQIWSTGPGTLTALRMIPAVAGMSAPLALGADSAPDLADDVFVLRLGDGSHVKARFYLDSTNIVGGYRRVRLNMLFHHEPAGSAVFSD